MMNEDLIRFSSHGLLASSLASSFAGSPLVSPAIQLSLASDDWAGL
jgi:hypothetical protein